ncbi:hypothetical protein [Tabrizicola sp.]|uniref:hypothetical protein n=1 Tax=Tabrizicola sp. TaxID=2005166 RepID=UPI00286D18EB|nr:hypothetical protein [Tabrizicola sp.]
MQSDSDVDAALDRTYEALLTGDLVALGQLAGTLERMPAPQPLDRASAERLARKADRNGRMLLAAARGVRAAQGRLVEIAAEPALTTYDARGRRESVGQVSNLMPRRI